VDVAAATASEPGVLGDMAARAFELFEPSPELNPSAS
jgi:hypothetical protein